MNEVINIKYKLKRRRAGTDRIQKAFVSALFFITGSYIMYSFLLYATKVATIYR